MPKAKIINFLKLKLKELHVENHVKSCNQIYLLGYIYSLGFPIYILKT